MKDIITLVFNKIIAALPSVVDSEAAFYRCQIEILLRVLENRGVQRILANPEEIRQLTALGKKLDHNIDERIMIVTPGTYRNWLRRRKKGDEIKRPGRKRSIAQSVVDTVVRLLKENPGWGWLRIVGELKKLGVKIAASTIARICKDNDLPMPPRKSGKTSVSTWAKFVKCNMENMVSCDFLSKDIFTIRGKFTAYSLAFIHYGSRRVFVSPPTYNPDEEWVMQQARNAAMWLDDERIKLRYLLHDHDTKFTSGFSGFFQRIIDINYAEPVEGKLKKGKVIRTAVRCPMQNGYIETWIGHFKQECLDWFWCFSLEQFGRVLYKYENFHNNLRPHQNMENHVLDKNFEYPQDFDPGKVRRVEIFGGLQSHYYLDDGKAQAA